MYGFFENPYRALRLSNSLLLGGLFTLILGAVVAYGVDQYVLLPYLIIAHTMTILGPTAIKLGYVLRLLTLKRLLSLPAS
ncbi:transmembrane sensor/regulator PpyR [Pseudomonas sp. TNT3]|jgi:hypothetical protein|nr:hypothetical protein [Pseudomonas sp. TNT3]KAI2684070.1 transmembrane sensor/regulator PpyR [Pseudomonas sp. TNT3]